MDRKLPNELWCQVFDYVPSLSHKFKLAAVNRRFRRCITSILEKPVGLELDFISKTKSGRGRLNGCAVRLDNWPVAVQVLAEITQFVSINFVCRVAFGIRDRDVGQLWGKILKILIEEDCLSEVTALKTQSLFGCHPNVWCSFLARCAKLQVLDLGGAFLCCSKLAVALRNKPLTELSLQFYWYKQTIFDALVSSLPKLSRCHIQKELMCHELNQLVPTLLSVLKERNRSTKLAMVYNVFPLGFFGCRAVFIIRQLQHHHPELHFDFDQDLHLNFELGNVSLCVQMGGYGTCQDVDFECINCHSFYPIVLDRIGEAALRDTSAHVEDYRLDRCRVGRVAADLKKWKGIEVTEVNQDHDLITFTLPNGNPFSNITIHSDSASLILASVVSLLIDVI